MVHSCHNQPRGKERGRALVRIRIYDLPGEELYNVAKSVVFDRQC